MFTSQESLELSRQAFSSGFCWGFYCGVMASLTALLVWAWWRFYRACDELEKACKK